MIGLLLERFIPIGSLAMECRPIEFTMIEDFMTWEDKYTDVKVTVAPRGIAYVGVHRMFMQSEFEKGLLRADYSEGLAYDLIKKAVSLNENNSAGTGFKTFFLPSTDLTYPEHRIVKELLYRQNIPIFCAQGFYEGYTPFGEPSRLFYELSSANLRGKSPRRDLVNLPAEATIERDADRTYSSTMGSFTIPNEVFRIRLTAIYGRSILFKHPSTGHTIQLNPEQLRRSYECGEEVYPGLFVRDLRINHDIDDVSMDLTLEGREPSADQVHRWFAEKGQFVPEYLSKPFSTGGTRTSMSDMGRMRPFVTGQWKPIEEPKYFEKDEDRQRFLTGSWDPLLDYSDLQPAPGQRKTRSPK